MIGESPTLLHFLLGMPPVDVPAAREYFGFQSFRSGQKELIEVVLDGKDALGVLPTEGGKSFPYQLPARTYAWI
jgi:superfamily II DNA helicase RecQ